MTGRKDFENLPRFFTVADAARLLQIHDVKVRRAILAGDLRAARLGRIYRIREDDLLAFYERNVVGAGVVRERPVAMVAR